MTQALPQTLTIESRDFALELYAFLRQLDRGGRWRNLEATASETLASLEAQLVALIDASWGGGASAALYQRLSDIFSAITAYDIPAPDAPRRETKGAWKQLKKSLQPLYEALSQSLSAESIHVPKLRPQNYARNVFHVASALFAVALCEFFLTSRTVLWVAGAFAGSAWTLETLRRPFPVVNRFCMWMFKPMAHPHEAFRINSATWYATALFLLSATGNLLVCAVALTVLGLGDPVAAVVGRKLGRVKLVNGRTLEGTVTFALVSALGVVLLLGWRHAALGGAAIALIAIASGIAGAVAELLSRRIDDNLTIPVTAGAAAWAVLAFVA